MTRRAIIAAVHRRWWYALIVVALLGAMAAAMVSTAVEQTPTIDEPVYVAAAVVYLTSKAGQFVTGKMLEVDGGTEAPTLDLKLPDVGA